MATVYWAPKSTYTAKVMTATVGGTLAGETFIIYAGGIAIATVVDTDTVVATVRAALVTAWNNSTHPYATGITAANGAGGVVTLTADTAGVDFTITVNTPGASATFTAATTQANVSPNDASVLANWSTGALPASTNDVLIAKGTPPILWGLAAITDTLDDVEIEAGAGPIGLPATTFQTGPNSVDTTVAEYRTTYLTLKCTDLFIGRNSSLSTTAAAGSTRIKVDTSTAASARIFTFSSAAQTGPKPPIQIKCNHSGTLISNYGAVIGVADDVLGDTSTCSAIYNYSPASRTITGVAVTVATIESNYGVAYLYSNPTSVLVAGSGAETVLFTAGTIPLKRGAGSIRIQGGQVAFTAAE